MRHHEIKALWGGAEKATKMQKNRRIGSGASLSGWTEISVVDPLHGIPYQCDRVVELEFLFDVGAVGLHGLDAHTQRCRDVSCALPCTDQPKHFQFAITQPLER